MCCDVLRYLFRADMHIYLRGYVLQSNMHKHMRKHVCIYV